MIAAAWRQWMEHGRERDIPLGAQIVALLLAGLVVAQVTTLILTVLLPPPPAPKYRMVEVARALQGGPLTVSNPRPLVRVVRNQPPNLESPDWVISDQSRADLARFVGAPVTDVRILFYSPLPLSRSGGASLAQATPLPSAEEQRQPVRASMAGFADFQMGPGGGGPPGGPQGGGFPGGGFGGVPARMPTSMPPSVPMPQTRPTLPAPSQPMTPVQTSTPTQTVASQPPATASAAAPTQTPTATPVWTTQAHAAQAVSGQVSSGQPASGQTRSEPAGETLSPPNGAGTTGPSPTGPGSVGVSPAGSAGNPYGQTRAPQPTLERLPEPVFAPATAVSVPDTPPSHVGTTTEQVSPIEDHTVAPRVEHLDPARPADIAADVPDAKAPEITGGFALSPADRGGYLLPSESAPVRGALGMPTVPYVQGDFVAAFQATPGHWVTVQPAPEPFPNTWQRRIMLWFFLSSIVVIPVGLIFARRLAAPLANFAEAAERLGRDPSGKQAPLNGPAEIGRAAHAFNEMQARLRRYIDDRTAMVGAISHDLRTPLARMRFRLERIPPQFHDGMAHDIAQMEEMITSVLAFIRDVNEPSVRDRVELRSILECVVDNASLMGGDVTLAPGERVPVDVDSLGIERVLTNLIDNALKYGDKAHVRVFQDGTDVVTEVEDEGPGLPAEELERVFLPFYRSDHSRNLNKTGIGLGLAVSRSIARAHGGDINLSPGDQGLRVQLRLPRASVAMAAG